MGGVVVGIFCCQIHIGCSETKLLICHKGGFFMGGVGGVIFHGCQPIYGKFHMFLADTF